MKRNAFTLIELMVVVLIIGLLIAILLPSLGQAMEAGKRIKCAANLNGLAKSFKIYQSANGDRFPHLLQGKDVNGQTVGAGDTIDTQNSLWLLISSKTTGPEVFICASDKGAVAFNDDLNVTNVAELAFPDVKSNGMTGDGNRSWSYCYQVPNGETGNPANSVDNPQKFAIMADRAPYQDELDDFATMTLADTDPLNDARTYLRGLDGPASQKVNSPNHGGKGQNVLFQDGHASWQPDPWCGVNNDNIYTRALDNDTTPSGRMKGETPSANKLPASDVDSLLVNINKGTFCIKTNTDGSGS